MSGIVLALLVATAVVVGAILGLMVDDLWKFLRRPGRRRDDDGKARSP